MPVSKNDACDFLTSLHRHDLAVLIRECDVAIEPGVIDNGWFQKDAMLAVVHAPPPISEALNALPQHDRKRIGEAIASADPEIPSPQDIVLKAKSGGELAGNALLLADLIVHREMMISVATGGKRIQEVDDYYRAREQRIRERIPEGVKYKNPHDSLWDWYHHWSKELPHYNERRHYVREMFGRAIDSVSRMSRLVSEPREPTGWGRVDRALGSARSQLERASAEEDFQGIGLLCREIIISLAQAVFDPSIHETTDGIRPSETDANRMIEAFVGQAMSGASNKEVRAHARASLSLALNLQHRRTATKQLASLCLEATASTAAVISIIARGGAST